MAPSIKKVGFYGGSFDPIHFGHLSLAISILEKHRLDQILFCPAYCSPFKKDKPPHASGEDRLEMLKRSLNHPKFSICSWEIEQKLPSYTIDTIRHLKKTCDGLLYLILADDVAKDLNQWKEPQELVTLSPPLIGKRSFPISSNEIRARLKNKLYCRHLVPKEALDFIQQHGLYS